MAGQRQLRPETNVLIMKTKLALLPLLLLCSFSVTSCDKEDGNINDWVGTYHWSSNEIQYWSYSLGVKTWQRTDYHKKEDEINMVINSDKTWKFPVEKDPKLGKSGRIKCYKKYINLLDMQNDYLVKSSYAFKLVIETGGTFLQYYKDTSIGRHKDHYDYTITIVSFKLVNN